jgi:hypothetical protein
MTVTYALCDTAEPQAAPPPPMAVAPTVLKDRLAQLEEARAEGLVMEDEYAARRLQIIGESSSGAPLSSWDGALRATGGRSPR